MSFFMKQKQRNKRKKQKDKTKKRNKAKKKANKKEKKKGRKKKKNKKETEKERVKKGEGNKKLGRNKGRHWKLSKMPLPWQNRVFSAKHKKGQEKKRKQSKPQKH